MKKIGSILLFFVVSVSTFAQGISFTELSFEKALLKAKDENKIVFADMYADWCGPCKMLSEQIFVLPKVGEYYNTKFISVKVDVESEDGKKLAQKYGVQGLPTLLYLDGDGKIVHSLVGAGDEYVILRNGRLATKEQPNEDAMYELYKKNKGELSYKKDILIDAPYFMRTLQGSTQERWALRVEAIFKEYLTDKGIENMLNIEDFNILAMYHNSMKKDDKIINFLIANYDTLVQTVNPKMAAQYLTGIHSNYVVTLAREKSKEYDVVLNRMKGDMQKIYAQMTEDTDLYYNMYKCVCDANFELYSKNTKGYIEHMDKMLTLSKPNIQNYSMIVQTLFNYTRGNLDKSGFEKSIEWLNAAMKDSELKVDLKSQFLIVLGDCFVGLKDNTKAKECYNQAYITSLELNDPQFSAQVKDMVVKKNAAIPN